jgi:predicted enzyme related to lactoylglutathione lyase
MTATGIDCVCYLAKDFKRATDFYENVLGLNPSSGADQWVEYDLADGTTFALAKLPNGEWYPTGGVMFAVPDVYAVVERLRAAGITIHGDIGETPVCTMAWCDDTEGNNFAVHKRK